MFKCTWILVFFVYFVTINTTEIKPKMKSGVPKFKKKKQFTIYWNMPTAQCQAYNISFINVLEKFNIIYNNKEGQFLRDKITVLQNPGNFPQVNNETFEIRNDGYPQAGSITLHIKKLNETIQRLIPDKNFSGLAVIVFNEWTPIYRPTDEKFKLYYRMSTLREKQLKMKNNTYNGSAQESYEKSARKFFNKTIEIAKKLRPKAKWGYINYPFCFDETLKLLDYNDIRCYPKYTEDNDKLLWLYKKVEILIPIIKLQSKINEDQNMQLIRSNVKETIRLAKKKKCRKNVEVLPYLSYAYHDDTNLLLSKKVLNQSFWEIKNNEADGIILWDHSIPDLLYEKQCTALFSYIEKSLGPAVQNFLSSIKTKCLL